MGGSENRRDRGADRVIGLVVVTIAATATLIWAAYFKHAKSPQSCLAVLASRIMYYQRTNSLPQNAIRSMEKVVTQAWNMVQGPENRPYGEFSLPEGGRLIKPKKRLSTAKFEAIKRRIEERIKKSPFFVMAVCIIAVFVLHMEAMILGGIPAAILGVLLGMSMGLAARAGREKDLLFFGKTAYTGTWSFFTSLRFIKFLTCAVLVISIGIGPPIFLVQTGVGAATMLVTWTFVGKIPRI